MSNISIILVFVVILLALFLGKYLSSRSSEASPSDEDEYETNNLEQTARKAEGM